MSQQPIASNVAPLKKRRTRKTSDRVLPIADQLDAIERAIDRHVLDLLSKQRGGR